MSQQKIDKLCLAANGGQEDVVERLLRKLKKKAINGRYTGDSADGWGKG